MTVAVPLICPTVARIIADPLPSPITRPFGVTCATDVSLLVHMTGCATVIGAPLESRRSPIP